MDKNLKTLENKNVFGDIQTNNQTRSMLRVRLMTQAAAASQCAVAEVVVVIIWGPSLLIRVYRVCAAAGCLAL